MIVFVIFRSGALSMLTPSFSVISKSWSKESRSTRSIVVPIVVNVPSIIRGPGLICSGTLGKVCGRHESLLQILDTRLLEVVQRLFAQ